MISDKTLKICNVPECDRPAIIKGYCNGHHAQIKRHGFITNPSIKVYVKRKPNGAMKVICLCCGKEFKRKNGQINQKYCSHKCSYKHRTPYNKKYGIIKCDVCGKEFHQARKTSKYCSIECRHIGTRKQVKVECHYCGKEISRPKSYIKWQAIRNHKFLFCSLSCSGKFNNKKGEDHHLWKGGLSRAYKYGYHSPEYKKWRNSVFDRDNFTCQICNKKNGYLHAHHIKSFSHFPNLRFVESNGITLCKDCHMEVHSRVCRKTPKNQKGIALQKEALDDLKRKKSLSAIPIC